MTPFELLGLTIGISAGAALLDALSRRKRRRMLTLLAQRWGMNYHPFDQLRLTPKVAHHFPVPGAANLKVTDVIYGMDKELYRYVFTAEFTTGVVHTKHRRVRVASFVEPRERGRLPADDSVTLAPKGKALLEQYSHLAPPNPA